MAVTKDDFNKIWASTSPLTPYSFSESQYKEGWNFVGATPPSRQMWDFLQKNNDEKMQYLANNYLPLNGGTLTGDVFGVTPPNGDNSKKLATTEFVNATALTYKQKKFNEPSKWEDNTIQSIARAFPDDHPAAYEYGVKVTLGKIKNEEGHTNLYFPHNGGMYLKNYWGSNDNSSGWLTMLTDQNYSQFALPKVVGAVVAFAGSTTPQGWLLCDGSAVSRKDYAALYAVIGTTYGAGDSSTTFNLPNLTDKFIQGSDTAGTIKSAGLPNIEGAFGAIRAASATGPGLKAGAFSGTESSANSIKFQNGTYYESGAFNADFKASNSNSIYGNSSTVQPPALTMRYIIKY